MIALLTSTAFWLLRPGTGSGGQVSPYRGRARSAKELKGAAVTAAPLVGRPTAAGADPPLAGRATSAAELRGRPTSTTNIRGRPTSCGEE